MFTNNREVSDPEDPISRTARLLHAILSQSSQFCPPSARKGGRNPPPLLK